MKRKYRYRPRRRGVLILVVLSLLTLFTLITITYVVVSKQAMSSSQTANRFEQVRPDHEALLNGALMQIMVDTNNRLSALFGNSLGADMYGTWLTGTVSSSTALSSTDNQFVELQVTVDPSVFGKTFPNVEDFYRGRVLTMTDGPAAGISSRIVFSPSDGTDIHVMAFSKTDAGGTRAVRPNSEDHFVINGREFAGVRPQLTGTQAPDPSLLAINLSSATFGANDNAVINALLGRNETYDAVDFNNPLLGRFPEQPGAAAGSSENTIIPSLHRPALIRYLMAQGGSAAAMANAMLRPQGEFHYMVKGQLDFTGKRFDPVNGPWDVDTDGDGILDAVWVDLGYPVLTTADGRSYKPLFAIRCQDMDGRVNVNAHGSLTQTQSDYETFRGKFAGGNGQDKTEPITTGMWKGQGVSPTEINPSYVIADKTTGARRSYDAHDEMMHTRYGSDGKPGTGAWTEDRRSLIATFRVPDLYNPSLGPLNKSYASPPDRQGRRYVGLDQRGQPIYSDGQAIQEFSGALRDPHRMLLTRFSPVGLGGPQVADEPYSVYEMERVLRRFDRDASLLPDRLLQEIDPPNASGTGVRRPRQDITVAGFGHPRPPVDIIELIRLDGRVSDIDAWVRNNLAPELLAGLPMDINRPFGDGIDNNGNRIVDEAEEGAANSAWNGIFPNGASVPLDLTNSGNTNNNKFARPFFARHLYCLAMLLVDRNYKHDFDGDGTSSTNETARWLAQWAVNVVDFRDSDAIMTRFVYDPNPFDGWSANDQNVATSSDSYMQNTVYGCEQPLLLLTEVVAWHDRRMQKVDPMTGEAYDDMGQPVQDGEFRQMGRPRGNLVIELYHPRNPEHAAPGWLYDASGQGLKLNQVDAQTGKSAVWRLAFTTAAQTTSNAKRVVLNPKQIKSVAYFTKNNNPANHPSDDLADELSASEDVGKRFFSADTTIKNPRANTYIVIGTAEKMMLGRRVEPGEEDMSTDAKAKEQVVYPVEIELDVASGRVTVGGESPPAGADQSDLKETVAVVMAPQYFNAAGTADSGKVATGRKRRFSFLEKPKGYTIEPDLEDANNIDNKYFEKAALKTKMPLDDQLPVIKEDKTTRGVRNVYLQRLADPTVPWNRRSNPYITVDMMDATANVVSLTSYSGDDPAGLNVTGFDGRQRGGTSDDIWRAESTTATGGSIDSPIAKATIGYLNSEFGKPLATGTDYKGDPSLGAGNKPFPWLTWNNRPFVSQLELLLVPGTDSRGLVTMHNTHERFRNGAYNPYKPTSSQPGKLPPAPFPHLMNFFHSKSGSTAAPELMRLLEFTHVPSTFVGTHTWLNPAAFVSGHGTEKHHPPFNKVSTYRQPGRINVNTIFSKEVFRSLMNNPDTSMVDSLWTRFLETRRGLPLVSSDADKAKLPTEYANPFRSSFEAGRVPISQMQRSGANATLLRSRLGGNEDSPLLAGTSSSDVNDAGRNPFFRYQPLMRLGNLTTTRSNVYAIWITLGFFEVSSVDPDGKAHPVDVNYKDGYRLVQELGSDTGDVERHRAFFIIDRSIPFGFQRGQNHNVHDAILLSRQIE
jgi:hypothetical protein